MKIGLFKIIVKSLMVFSLLELLMLIGSCESKLTIQKVLRKNYYKVIELSSLHQRVLSDTVLTVTKPEGVTPSIKIVVYIPQQLCSPCFRNYLSASNDYTKQFSSDSVQYICVMSPRPISEIQEAMDSLELAQTLVLYDNEDQYLKKNSLEKYTDMFRAFLLDKKNRVVLVGDPLRSTDLQKLYTEKIRELITNGGELPKKKSLLKTR
jgi:hypothetical protein